eukprot:m.295829 g.295829  ORF g.295829 m.295829 type:complete len:219 (-) comp61965_c0_seq1:81-737(-)
MVILSQRDIFVFFRTSSSPIYTLITTVDNSMVVTSPTGLPQIEATPAGFITWEASLGKVAVHYIELRGRGIRLTGNYTLDQGRGFTVFQSFSGNSNDEGLTIAASAWIVSPSSVITLLFDPSDFSNPVEVELNGCGAVANTRAIMMNRQGVIAQPVVSRVGNSTLGLFVVNGEADPQYLGVGGEFGIVQPNTFAVAGDYFLQTKRGQAGVVVTNLPVR